MIFIREINKAIIIIIIIIIFIIIMTLNSIETNKINKKEK